MKMIQQRLSQRLAPKRLKEEVGGQYDYLKRISINKAS